MFHVEHTQERDKMTRNDYQNIANEIRAYLSLPELQPATMENRVRRNTVDDIIEGLADVFATDNPNFDRGRFVSACIPN